VAILFKQSKLFQICHDSLLIAKAGNKKVHFDQ